MSNDEVLQDFRRRYENTYVFLHMEEKNIETLVNVRKIEASSSKIGVIHLVSEEYGAMTLNLGSDGHSLKFKYPPVGVFQYGRDAYMFRRRPERQYRRGICSDNSTLWNVTRNFAGSFANFSAAEVQAAFEHRTHTVGEALDQLSRGKMRSIALDNNFSVSHSVLNTPDLVIWNWQYPVARCDSKGKITRVYEDVFKPQLEELF